MALRDLWLNTPEQIRDKHVQQIIAFAGEGKLLDGGAASAEFRALLDHLPSELLRRYATECLVESFQHSGLALQDVVNEVGRRLGFNITPGRYRGGTGKIGFDGIWTFPDGHAAVVEVKTTDAYRIDLNTIATYRRALIGESRILENASSILIVVGREDTGDLEAQIRGSRHAWDIRVISVEALMRLLSLKEELEDPGTVRRIHNLLIPREFTRLDDIVDLVFSTAEEVRQDDAPDEAAEDVREPARDARLDPVAFHQECIARIQRVLQIPLLRESRVTYVSPDRDVAVVCAVSREYDRASATGYWFAFHHHQKETLSAVGKPYVAFGCGSAEQLLLIPFMDFASWLEGMNTTERPERMYWHVHIVREEDGHFLLIRRKGFSKIDVSRYVVKS
ncbi:MAG TPA: hypothetical protein VGD79_01500 [Thermoanaerobaculia bacterium]|jgi:hypothetical protein